MGEKSFVGLLKALKSSALKYLKIGSLPLNLEFDRLNIEEVGHFFIMALRRRPFINLKIGIPFLVARMQALWHESDAWIQFPAGKNKDGNGHVRWERPFTQNAHGGHKLCQSQRDNVADKKE